MRLFHALHRAPLFAALFMLLIAAPAQSQPPLPLPEMPTNAPRADVRYNKFSYPYYTSSDRLGTVLEIGGTLENPIIAAQTIWGDVQLYTHHPGYGYVIAQRIEVESSIGSQLTGRGVKIEGSGIGATLVIGGFGHAYVYVFNGTTWVLQADLTVPSGNIVFGNAVAISGTGDNATIAIAASSMNYGTLGGAVYVFTRTGTVWTQQAEITPSIAQSSQSFGSDVALAGTGDNAILVIGASGYNSPTFPDEGRAYVYKRNGTIWTQHAVINNPDPVTAINFGRSVDIVAEGSAYTVAASARSGVISAVAPGFVAVYNGTLGGALTQNRVFRASDFSTVTGWLGQRASLSGSPSDLMLGFGLAVGHTMTDVINPAARRAGGTWTLTQVSPSSAGTIDKDFGLGVAVHGTGEGAMLVASTTASSPMEGAGELLIARLNAAGTWDLGQRIYNIWRPQALGYAVAALDTGTTKVTAAGAPESVAHGAGSGAVRIFDVVDGAWQSTAVLNNPAFQQFGRFGQSVALAETGENIVLAVGAPDNNGAGSYTGEVFIYTRPKNPVGMLQPWSAPIKITASDAESGDQFGSEVKLADTDHGLMLAVGAYGHDGIGAVYIFKFESGTWQEQQIIVADGLYLQGVNLDFAADGNDVLLAVYGMRNYPIGERVAIFKFDGTAWSEQTRLAPIPEDAVIPVLTYPHLGAGFGASSSFWTSGERALLAVGVRTYGSTYENAPRAATYIYERDGNDWNLVSIIRPESAEPMDGFGGRVAWSSASDQPILAVSATGIYSQSFYVSTYVSLFSAVSGQWLPFATFSTGTDWDDGYAHAIALVGNRDAYTLTVGEYAYEGAIHIYEHLSLSMTGIDGLAVTEGGAGDSYTIALPLKPTASVDIVITTDGQCALNGLDAGAALVQTFTPATWNAPQTVTVTAVDDSITEGPHACTLSHELSSADAGYGSLAVAPTTVQIADNDAVQATELLTNGGFELALSPAWTVRNVTGDKRVCSAKGDGSPCAFKFTGGTAEKSSLNQTIELSGTRATASIFTLSGQLSAGAGKSLKIKVKTVYADGSADVYVTTWESTSAGYQTYQSVFAQVTEGAARIVLTIVNKNSSGKLWLDDLSLTALETRSAAPLPEQAPDSFRGQN